LRIHIYLFREIDWLVLGLLLSVAAVISVHEPDIREFKQEMAEQAEV
jgi:hypothetical protein